MVIWSYIKVFIMELCCYSNHLMAFCNQEYEDRQSAVGKLEILLDSVETMNCKNLEISRMHATNLFLANLSMLLLLLSMQLLFVFLI